MDFYLHNLYIYKKSINFFLLSCSHLIIILLNLEQKIHSTLQTKSNFIKNNYFLVKIST